MTHIPFWLGVLGANIGITAAFWHASWIAGVIFVACEVIAIILVLPLYLSKDSVNKGGPR